MKQVELRPIRERPEDFDRIEAKIKELFRQQIYLPLVYALGGQKNLIKNSTDDLIDAIISGKIYFNRGKFTGKFNSTISKELMRIGATKRYKEDVFEIPRSKLNIHIKHAIDVAHSRFQETAAQIDKKLSAVIPEEIASKLKIEDLFDATLYKVDQDFNQSVKNITVAPKLTPERRAFIAKEYTENLKLYIQGWLDEEIIELRQKVQKQSFAGYRYESLIKTIQDSYQVSQNKAKFLARQETGLLMAKFKETRYADAGVYEYKWRCVAGSPNHPVRPRHKQLNDESLKGKIFRFDDPPITTEVGEPVRRNNPGEDYNCRCTSVPVVKFA